MSFTLETIGQRCASAEEYDAGKALVQQVKLDSVQSFWKGEVTVLASVTEREQKYSVRMSLHDGEYQDCQCNCGESLRGLCRHGAAVSIAYYTTLHRKSQLQASTSPAMQKILKEYQSRGIANVMQTQQEGNARLIPLLSCQNGRAQVRFKIGNGKKSYVLKDLVEFYFHMQLHETVSYGKTWELVHSEWSFARENLPVLSFVLHVVEKELEYFRQYNPYRSDTMKKCRELTLTKDMLDQLMSLYCGEKIGFTDEYGWDKNVEVAEEDPRLHIRLSEEAEGYRLVLKENVRVLEGEQRLYLISADRISCTSEAYACDMAPFLRETGKGIRAVSYVIHRRDMPGLCGQLLPCLEKWAAVDKGSLKLEQYTPKPVEAVFSFDMNEKGAVTCEEKLVYGDFSFNPVKGSSVPVDVYRDYPGEYRIRILVERYFRHCDQEDGVLLLYDESEIFRLIESGIGEFMQLGEVYVSEAFKSVKVLPSPKISVGVSLEGTMLELTVDSGGLSETELAELLKNYRLRKKFYRLKKGEFIRIEDTSLAVFSELADGLQLSSKELVKEKLSVPVYRAMYLERVLSEGGIDGKRSREFKSLIRDCKNIEDSDFEVPKRLAGTLRNYQKTGYRWLRTLSKYGFGGILADEMGLGKTIQVIALLLSVQEELKHPALILCPASLVYNWENELHRFAPELSVRVISGTAQEREELLQQEEHAQVWVTSYDLLKRDLEQYEKTDFSYQIIDEAQVIKNHSTQGAKAVKAIHAAHRFALTGTPMENRLSELWSIFDYLMPGYLYSYSFFREELEIPIVKKEDERAALRLRRLLKPFVLRRVKQEVLKELPEKLETVVYSKMEEEQHQLYAAYTAKVREKIEQSTPKEYREGKIQILAALTRLRQLCCDPELCYENYKGTSAKLNVCMELIEEGMEGGHRFLLFSQFTTMLERISLELEQRKISHFILTGSTPKQERIRMSEQFNDGEGDVFLISLKAGGTGLNLTGADMVIHYDPWWNLAAQNQATDRAHRIGQTKKVTVLKLVTKGTIEENIIRLQEKKQRLAEQIIDGEGGSLSAISQEELLQLLNEI